jgi:chemotaxis protein CheX
MEQKRLVSIIESATLEVFSTMLGIPAKAGPAFTEQAGSQNFDGVVALIGLAGSWAGTGRITCSPGLACRLSGALLCSEYSHVNEDVLDAIAELTNMIIGNVKSAIEEELGPMGLSIPTVIFGRNYKARSCGVNEWIVVPFQADGEQLDVKLALAPSHAVPEHKKTLAIQEAV